MQIWRSSTAAPSDPAAFDLDEVNQRLIEIQL